MFLHGNPGPSADWEQLVAAAGARGMRAVAWDAPGFGGRRDAFGFRADRRRARRVHRPGGRRARDRPGARGRPRLRRTVGPALGRRPPAAVRTGGADRHRRAARLLVARARARLAHAAARRAVHGHHHPAGLPAAAAPRSASRSRAPLSTACTTASAAPPGGPCSTSIARTGRGRRRNRAARALAPLDRPALVLWGAHDPHLRVEHAERQREAFPHAEVRCSTTPRTGRSSTSPTSCATQCSISSTSGSPATKAPSRRDQARPRVQGRAPIYVTGCR